MSAKSLVSQTVTQLRDSLRLRIDCTFVEPDEFCRLLVSRRTLISANEPAADVRGLLEPGTGLRYLIEQERLGQ